MNPKTCKICSGVLIGLSLGQFLVCSECGLKYDFCNQPDLPVDNIGGVQPITRGSGVNLSASSIADNSTPADFPDDTSVS